MEKNEQILREGRFSTLLLRLSVPSIVIMVVMVLYNMADVFFIGQLQDAYKIAAVGLVGPVCMVCHVIRQPSRAAQAEGED